MKDETTIFLEDLVKNYAGPLLAQTKDYAEQVEAELKAKIDEYDELEFEYREEEEGKLMSQYDSFKEIFDNHGPE